MTLFVYYRMLWQQDWKYHHELLETIKNKFPKIQVFDWDNYSSTESLYYMQRILNESHQIILYVKSESKSTKPGILSSLLGCIKKLHVPILVFLEGECILEGALEILATKELIKNPDIKTLLKEMAKNTKDPL